MSHHHFLLLSCPGQGHLNPTLELAKKLTCAAAKVTLATTIHGLSRITTLPPIENLSYASFSDGNDDGSHSTADPQLIMSEFRRVGTKSLTQLLTSFSQEGRPVTFIIYTVLLPWAAAVAREFNLPSAFLSIQSATAFAIYHRYFNSHNGLYPNQITPPISIELPGLPLFSSNEIPSFLLPDSPYTSVVPCFQEHILTLEEDPNPLILVNTFDELEEDSIRAVDHMNMISIGPLVPSDHNPPRIDLFEKSTDYLQWLDSKTEKSVIYVSFGSIVVMQKKQIEEILQGLVKIHRPFLWVLRKTEYDGVIRDLIESELKGEEEGLIVPWCSQVEVLNHISIGCFLTHCGWNSVVESLIAGVPMAVCPQFSDQTTNAKMVDEVWGTGVRTAVNGEGVVEREEVGRCLDMVMGGGERGEEIRSNCMKWKGLAVGAVEDGGSSHRNFKQFLEN